jgi:hypothetical protein
MTLVGSGSAKELCPEKERGQASFLWSFGGGRFESANFTVFVYNTDQFQSFCGVREENFANKRA